MCVPMEGYTREVRGVRRGPDKMVRFITYTIRNWRNRVLELALHGLAQVQVDRGVMQ